MSDMSTDTKVKRLVRKYGVEGYGLYTYILELVVRRLESNSPIPDLEDDSQDIASDMNMDTLRVEEIMWFCIQQGLFEQDELTGRLVAHKVYKFLDTAQTRSPEISKMINSYKKASGAVSDNHRLSQPEQKRTEQTRTDEEHSPANKDNQPSSSTERVEQQPGVYLSDEDKRALREGLTDSQIKDYCERVSDYQLQKGKKYKDHRATIRNWAKKDGAWQTKPKQPTGDRSAIDEVVRRKHNLQ